MLYCCASQQRYPHEWITRSMAVCTVYSGMWWQATLKSNSFTMSHHPSHMYEVARRSLSTSTRLRPSLLLKGRLADLQVLLWNDAEFCVGHVVVGGRLRARQRLGRVGARERVLAEHGALATHESEVRHLFQLRTERVKVTDGKVLVAVRVTQKGTVP